jgi:hypothetical protein
MTVQNFRNLAEYLIKPSISLSCYTAFGVLFIKWLEAVVCITFDSIPNIIENELKQSFIEKYCGFSAT